MAMSSLQLWNGDKEDILLSDQTIPDATTVVVDGGGGGGNDIVIQSERALDVSSSLKKISLLRKTKSTNSKNEDPSFYKLGFWKNPHLPTMVHNDTMSQQESKFPNMESKLKYRYDRLPLPPWPQLDHRTSSAILHGYMQGFDPNASPYDFHQSNTIVTAYYEFESKHGVAQYEKWFSRILRTCEPMIIFVEPESRWFDFVKEQRRHAPTIVVPLSFDHLVMSSTFLPSFWDFMHGIDLEAKIHKGSGVYKIWNEKLVSVFECYHVTCSMMHIHGHALKQLHPTSCLCTKHT